MAEPIELWRRVAEAPAYEVSSFGRVRRGDRIVRPRPAGSGYLRVTLSRGRLGQLERYVSRLVCEAFHGPAPDPSCHADHIDNDKTNNAAANLRWLIPAANLARRRTPKGEGHYLARINEQTARTLKQRYRQGESPAALASELGLSSGATWCCCTDKTWKHVT